MNIHKNTKNLLSLSPNNLMGDGSSKNWLTPLDIEWRFWVDSSSRGRNDQLAIQTNYKMYLFYG